MWMRSTFNLLLCLRMSLFKKSSKIIITCSNRLSPVLQQEVVALGFTPEKVFKTGVELKGTLVDCMILNIHLRCASQVLFLIHEMVARDANELYNNVVKYSWDEIIAPDAYFSITSNVTNETITNNLFANVRLKDGMVDYFRNKHGVRPDSGQVLNGAVIHLYWKEDHAEIFIDTSGETLSKHGYRKIPGKAPMLESLAAATILTGKWDRNSTFVNPMCGSGTLAIEAALIATNRVPGLYRNNYSFMHLVGYDEKFYDDLIQKTTSGIVEKPDLKIIATDISEDAVYVSKVNAGMAGVEEMIEFAVCDFADTKVPEGESGVVYFNPEYGDRLGVEEELVATYKRIGDFMKSSCKGYTGYIFTGNLELAKKIGLKAARRIEFYTSKIDCRLLEYELYAGSRKKEK